MHCMHYPLVGEAGADADDADEVVHGVVQPHVAVEVAARRVVDHVRKRDRQRLHLPSSDATVVIGLFITVFICMMN